MSVYPRKSGIYHYDFVVNRVRFHGSTGLSSRREAEEFERIEREKAETAVKNVAEQRTAPMTINVAFDRFWLEVGAHYKGNYGKTFLTALAWLSEELGPQTLIRNIGPSRVTEAIARRRGQNVSNATVNRTVTEPLRAILKRASELWEQETQRIKWGDLMLAEPKERVRELRDHEETDLVPNMREDYRDILAFFLVSGCRLKEAVNLQWSDIDWRNQTITITGKGDKVAVIPLTNEMKAILAPLRGHHPTYVFTYRSQRDGVSASGMAAPRGTRNPITYEGMKTAWRRYGGAAAGLKDFRLHDTRHTAATRLLRVSGNLRLVQKLLRHEDISTTAKYAHADINDLRSAMEKVSKSRRASRHKASSPKEKADKSSG